MFLTPTSKIVSHISEEISWYKVDEKVEVVGETDHTDLVLGETNLRDFLFGDQRTDPLSMETDEPKFFLRYPYYC